MIAMFLSAKMPSDMWGKIWVPDWLYRCWPYLVAGEAGVAFFLGLNLLGIALLIYSVSIVFVREA